MNINEVEKQVKFNMFITCLIYVLTGLCFIVSIIAIVVTPVKAATSELRTNDISNTIRNTTDCGSQSYGYFCNNAGLNDTHKEQINSLQVGYLYSIKMDVSVNTWFTQSPSTIEIYNSNNTFRNISYTCSLTSTNSQNNISCNVVYVNGGKIIVNFNTGNYVPGELTIRATNTNSAYMNTGNYTISRIVQLQTINSDNSDVIDNANQNTTNIINNNNENTQELINNQNNNNDILKDAITSSNWNILSQIANVCNNTLDINSLSNGVLCNSGGGACNTNIGSIISRNSSTGSITYNATSGWLGFYSPYLPIENYDLYIKFTTNYSNLLIKVDSYDSDRNHLSHNGWNVSTNTGSGSYSFNLCSSSNVGVCNPVSTQYIRFSIESRAAATFTLSSLTVNSSNGAFCPFGSINGNRLDGIQGAIQGGLNTVNDSIEDVKDLQQEQNDYLMDDTNPTVNSSDINNVISNVQVQDPLNYLLTLPLNLLTKLNTLISADSCSRVSFGELFGTELYLPCINFEDILGGSLWDTIDIIVGIGLLVIVIKRFYDSISNILTLGKEKEVRDKLDLPTPMEFLSMILGGGR